MNTHSKVLLVDVWSALALFYYDNKLYDLRKISIWQWLREDYSAFRCDYDPAQWKYTSLAFENTCDALAFKLKFAYKNSA